MKLISKALTMARVNGITQIYLPATHTLIHEWSEPFCLYSLQQQSITTLWPVLISRSTEGRRLRWYIVARLYGSSWFLARRASTLGSGPGHAKGKRPRRRTLDLENVHCCLLTVLNSGLFFGHCLTSRQFGERL